MLDYLIPLTNYQCCSFIFQPFFCLILISSITISSKIIDLFLAVSNHLLIISSVLFISDTADTAFFTLLHCLEDFHIFSTSLLITHLFSSLFLNILYCFNMLFWIQSTLVSGSVSIDLFFSWLCLFSYFILFQIICGCQILCISHG